MSIADKIQRLQTAKTNIATAITNKGGIVNSGDGYDDFATDIATIPSGEYNITVTDNGDNTINLAIVDAIPHSYTNVFVPSEAEINYRLGSSGTTSAQSGSCTTNYIDITGFNKSTDYIYVKGFEASTFMVSSGYFMGYNSSKTKTSYEGTANSTFVARCESLGTNYFRINCSGMAQAIFTNAQYIRFNFYPKGSTTAISLSDVENIIITLNEEIL